MHWMGCRKTTLKARKRAKVSNGNSFAGGAMTIGTVENGYEESGRAENGNQREGREEVPLPAPLGSGFLILSVSFVHGLNAPISILA